MKPVILKNHIDNRDTIAYKNFVMNQCLFLDLSNDEQTKERLDLNNITGRQYKEILDALNAGKGDIDTSDELPRFAYEYCRQMGVDKAMRDIVLNSNDALAVYFYCRDVSNDDDMRQMLISLKDPCRAYHYCRDISNDSDMRQVIIDCRSPEDAFFYCSSVSIDADMRQVIIDARDPKWATEWLDVIDQSDEQMLEIELSKPRKPQPHSPFELPEHRT